jgi:hypothetical protein
VDRAYRGCPLPTAPRDWPAEPTRPLPGGDGHFISGHWALAPVRHIRLIRAASWSPSTPTSASSGSGAVPAAERAAAGLRNPSGPIAAPDFGSALIAVGVWQAMFFIALRGWPVNTIIRRPARLLAGNALVIGLGAVTYPVLRNLAHWQPDAISAACGCIISATLIVAMLFEGWPAARLLPAPGRVLTLALTALVALALDRALAAYAGSVRWAQATPTSGSPPPPSASSELASSSTSASDSAGHSPTRPMRENPGLPGNPQTRRAQARCRHQRRRPGRVPRHAHTRRTLTDDGNPRSLRDRIDREIFTAHGHMTVESERRWAPRGQDGAGQCEVVQRQGTAPAPRQTAICPDIRAVRP